MHVLSTGVPRCLGVGRSALSPKAAQVLGCSLNSGLRISFGLVTCMARTDSVPGLWTLGFLLLCGGCVWVWVSFQPRQSWLATWVGVLGYRFCFAPPFLAVVCGLCGWARVSAAPRNSWLGCWGVCVFVCLFRLYPATPGWGAQCGCMRLGSGSGCAPSLLAWVLRCVCVCVCASLVPHHSWLVCALWVCLLGPGFRLRPTTPGWGVAVCVCLCARSTCTPAVLAVVSGVGVFDWARVSAALCHSWLGCGGVRVFLCVLCFQPATPGWDVRCGCVLGLGFRLRPATRGWGVGVCVCLCARYSRNPPLLAGVCSVGVCVWAQVSSAPVHATGCCAVCVLLCALCLVPCHFWLGRVVRVCVLGLRFRLRPVPPGWGFQVYLCLCACSACTPPLLAGVCHVGVRAWARVSAAPRHAWLGCWGLCVLVCALCSYPATRSWGVRCGCVCLCLGFGCAPPLLAGVLGCVCACVRAPPVARHSWLGRSLRLCVLGLGFWLRPATPGWLVGVCVCLCACFACTPPLLAGVWRVGVCAWAQVSAAPRHYWLGCWAVCVFVYGLCLYPATPGWGVRCWFVRFGSGCGCAPPLLAGLLGCVFVCVRAPFVPRHSWLECAMWVCVLGLPFRLPPATPGWGVGVCG